MYHPFYRSILLTKWNISFSLESDWLRTHMSTQMEHIHNWIYDKCTFSSFIITHRKMFNQVLCQGLFMLMSISICRHGFMPFTCSTSLKELVVGFLDKSKKCLFSNVVYIELQLCSWRPVSILVNALFSIISVNIGIHLKQSPKKRPNYFMTSKYYLKNLESRAKKWFNIGKSIRR